MKLQEQNILFFTRTMGTGGTENVVLQLCEIFKPIVKKIVVCSSGGVNVLELQKIDIKHYTIPDIVNRSPKNFLLIQKQLNRIIRDEKISVIHTHHRMAAFHIQFLRTRNNILLINTSHTAFYDKRVLTHIAYNRFNLIACGEGVKKSLVDGLGFKEDQIRTIYNGVRVSSTVSFETIPEIAAAKSENKHVYAYIGRLSAEKGVDYLIRAVPLLYTHNTECIIVGTGPEENKIRNLAEQLRIEKNVVFLGYREDTANIIAQVDFLVQPSLQEGLPLVPIEAFSLGKAVVGTDIDGISEIVTHMKNGILVPAANEETLAEAIDYMCNNDLTEMEKSAFETYKKRYTFDAFANNYISYYKSLKSNY